MGVQPLLSANSAVTPNAHVSAPDVIDEAMITVDTVLLEMIKARMPQLNREILHLRTVSASVNQTLPILIRVVHPMAGSTIIGGIDFQVQPLS
jgi:hypothetical protein